MWQNRSKKHHPPLLLTTLNGNPLHLSLLSPISLLVRLYSFDSNVILLTSAHAAGAMRRATEQAYSAKACTPNGCEAAIVRVVHSLHAPNRLGRLTPRLVPHGSGCFTTIRLKIDVCILV